MKEIIIKKWQFLAKSNLSFKLFWANIGYTDDGDENKQIKTIRKMETLVLDEKQTYF